jgi:hypothetical protein
MRLTIAFAILTLLPNCALAQPAESDSAATSRLDDSVFVTTKIKQISDAELIQALDMENPVLGGLDAALLANDTAGLFGAWQKYWRSKEKPIYIQKTQELLIDTEMLTDEAGFAAYIEAHPEEKDRILSRADEIMRNQIRTWGENEVAFGETVDFDMDLQPSEKYGFHYWGWSRPLTMAYLLTRDSTYLTKFEELFNRWYEQRNSIRNPFQDRDVVYYELGLGIRNRMFIEYYLLPHGTRAVRTDRRILKTLLGAARWLYELEEWEGYRPGNWQIHGSYMLVQIALTCEEFKESGDWLRLGLQRLEEHLDRDFYDDGGHWERSPRNYTLATYMVYRNLYHLLNAHGSHPELAERVRFSLSKTVDWWITMIAPTGEIPAINDSHRGLFPTMVLQDAADLYQKPEALAILRELLKEKVDTTALLPAYTSRHMPSSGFTVMRTDWSWYDLYMNINHGPSGGGHTHNDLLSFELYAYGRALAVDAGIGRTYDDPMYDRWYKSSRAHNMVVVDEEEMERVGRKAENVLWSQLPSVEYFAGGHDGFRLQGVRHRRHIAFVKPSYWFILDEMEAALDGSQLSWFIHTPEVLMNAGGGFQTFKEPGLFILPATPGLTSRRGMGWAASTSDLEPGAVELASWCAFEQRSVADSTHRFGVLLFPYGDRAPLVSTSRISPQHYVVRGESFEDHIVFSGGPYRDDQLATDATFVWIRMEEGGRTEFAVVDGANLLFKNRVLWEADEKASEEGVLNVAWPEGPSTEAD